MSLFDGHSIKFESAEFLVSMGSTKEIAELTKYLPTYIEPID